MAVDLENEVAPAVVESQVDCLPNGWTVHRNRSQCSRNTLTKHVLSVQAIIFGDTKMTPGPNDLIARFKYQKLLNQDSGGRRIILQGNIDDKPALLLAERAAFSLSLIHI